MKIPALVVTMILSADLSGKHVYDHALVDIDGRETSLKEHEGKVLLIVNVASRCGFTGQYEGLEKLYKEYKSGGLVVCGFPCNQFGRQEPGTEKEIKKFCSEKFGVTFPMYAKIEVKGSGMHPLYASLTGKASATKGGIKWNFTKILVDRVGKPIVRFGSLTSPSSRKLRAAVEQALKK